MKSLFALGAWSLAALSLTGVAFGQYATPPASSGSYWMTSDGAEAPVGTGAAPQTMRPPAPANHHYGRPPATFGQVNYQRGGSPSDVAPPSVAPPSVAPPQTPYAPVQVAPDQVGPAQIGAPGKKHDGFLLGRKHRNGLLHRHGSGWFGGVGGLIFDRDDDQRVWLSVDDGNITDKVLTTRHANMEHAGGFEFNIGRYFDDNCRAWQLTYWGLYPSDQDVLVYNGTDTVGQLGSSRTFDGLQYNGAAVATAFNAADAHWLQRRYEFHNVEWNIFGSPCATGCGDLGCTDCGPSLRWNWLAGFRYFRFDEGMTYAADAANTVFTGDVDEVYYNIDVDNHLFGFQVGGIADYCLTSRWNWRNAVKLGLYGSHIDHNSRIYGSAGNATVNNINSPYNGQDWLVNSDKDDIAVLGEWDTALTYQCSSNWRARFGYRVVAVNGVAFAAQQIPDATYVDLHEVELVDSNGSLILHGGYASLEFNY